MPLIEVSDEDLKFLRELAHEMETQDNVGTAAPRYYTAMTKEEYIAPTNFGDKTGYYCTSEGERYSAQTEEELKTLLIANGHSPEEAAEIADDSEYGVHVVERHQNFFLTKKGYDEHMRLNRHNYAGGPVPYMNHAFRNPELMTLIKVIARIGRTPCSS